MKEVAKFVVEDTHNEYLAFIYSHNKTSLLYIHSHLNKSHLSNLSTTN